MKLFKDPESIFSIMIPTSWTYNEKKELGRENLHQFEVVPGTVFQISANPVNERIANIIEANNIIPHDFSLPEISFIEDFQNTSSMQVYTWMALIVDKFFLAVYYYDKKIKEQRNHGLDLYEVRMGLRNLVFHGSEITNKSCPHFISNDENYQDINNWRDHPTKYRSNIANVKKFKVIGISPLNLDVVKLYALLTLKVSQQPNGFFDLLKVKKPLDNTIWWDFVLECKKGFIHIWRTPFIIEVQYYFDGEFDVELFFKDNIERNIKEIEAKIKTFEKHTIYINHYQSYSRCVETLWKEIEEIDLTVPEAPATHVSEQADMSKYSSALEAFSANSVRYHTLAKSMVLHAAFKVESYLNLVIRIGSTPELKLYPDVLSRFLKLEFAQRVKNLRFYSLILTEDIDMGSNIYRETKELMTLRNKYVHYEEDAIHNRIGEIYYDRDYPLHPLEKNRPAIDSIIKTFHQPDFAAVKKAYETSGKFITMIEDLFIPELKQSLQFLIEQNPIGYNETKGIYSAINMPMSLDFFTASK
ncbi:hypothetical protein [Pedobacter sp. SYSU D00535]|uniref:hypothetical protein n=1 Tax=Pedobacter sp. SYSU D00535 TaxID=2810308 RepID=UPI001A97ABA1|nr:hypothetical protein [Pedobacter sp. SYSU D00535]